MVGSVGREVGRVSLRVKPNTNGFRDETERQLRKVAPVHLNIAPKNLDKFGAQLEKALAKYKVFKIKVVLDTTEVRKQFKKLHSDLGGGRKVAIGGQVNIDPKMNNKKLQGIQKYLNSHTFTAGIEYRFADPSTVVSLKAGRLLTETIKERTHEYKKQKLILQSMAGEDYLPRVKAAAEVRPKRTTLRDKASARAKATRMRAESSHSITIKKTLKLNDAIKKRLNLQKRLQQFDKLKEKAKAAPTKAVGFGIDKAFYRQKRSMEEALAFNEKLAKQEKQYLHENRQLGAQHIRQEIQRLRKIKEVRQQFGKTETDDGRFGDLHTNLKRAEAIVKHNKKSRINYTDEAKANRNFAEAIERVSKAYEQLNSVSKKAEQYKPSKEFEKATNRLKANDGIGITTRRRNREIQSNAAANKMKTRLVATASAAKLYGNSIRNNISTRTKAAQRHIRNMRAEVKHLSEHLKPAKLVNGLKQFASVAGTASGKVKALAKGMNNLRKQRKARKGPGSKKFFGLTRVGWIVSAVAALAAPATGLIAGALGAIPSLAATAAAAIGVVALGFAGIKDAAKAINPAMDKVKGSISDVFRERLTPQFKQLGEGLLGVEPNLKKVAHGLSDFTQGMVDAATKGRGFKNIQKTLDNTAKLFSDTAPFAKSFTEAMLELGAIGSESFPLMARGLNQFGSSLKKNIQELGEGGTMQRAIESTYRSIGSFSDNVGKIIRSGVQNMPTMETGIKSFFDGFGNGIEKMMPTFAKMSNVIFDTIGVAFNKIGDIFERIGPKLRGIFDDLGPGLKDFVSGFGDFSKAGLDVLFGFVKGISPAAGNSLSSLGNGFRQLGEAIDSYDWAGKAEGLGKLLGKLTGFHDLDTKAEPIKGKGRALWHLQNVGGLSFTLNQQRNLLKKKLEVANVPLEIDLSPVIKAADHAKSKDQIDMLYKGVEDLLKNQMTDNRAKIQALLDGADPIEVLAPDFKVKDFNKASKEFERLSQQTGESIQNYGRRLKEMALQISKDYDIEIPAPTLKMLDDIKFGDQGKLEAGKEQIIKILNEHRQKLKEEASKPLTVPAPEVKMEAGQGLGAVGQLQAHMSQQLQPMVDQVNSSMDNLGNEMSAAAKTKLDEAQAKTKEVVNQSAQNIGQSFGEALGGVEIDTSAFSDKITNSLTQMNQAISEKVAESATNTKQAIVDMVNAIGDGFAESSTVVTTAMNNIAVEVSNGVASIVNASDGAIHIKTKFEEAFNGIANSAREQAQAAANSWRDGITNIQTDSQSITQAAANAIRSNLNINVYSSGVAVGSTFAAGLRSQIGNVSAAADALAAAARRKFPNSPAKEGPFSGSGWIEHSGDSVGNTFAAGLRRSAKTVSEAANNLMTGARAPFENFGGTLEGAHRLAIDNKTRAANAKKIADSIKSYDKQVEKAKEDHAKKLNEWEKKEGKKGKAPEFKMPEYKLPELDKPDYSEINRSFNDYVLGGISLMIKNQIDAAVPAMVSGAKGAAEEISRVFGRTIGHQNFMDGIIGRLSDPKVSSEIQRILEEAKVHEIPVTFAVQNLNQLKSDLGMTDGVISRVMDIAMSHNPAEKPKEPGPAIHYHVLDVNEAMRIEEVRKRKDMFKKG